MDKKLEGKIAVITGATSGLALATAKRFVAEGAYVFITGRRQAELDRAVQELGRNVTGVQGDVGKLADLDRLFATVKKEKGHIDVLYASAGIAIWAPLADVTEAQFDQTFDVNAKGTFFTVQKALPLLRDGASIIMTGTIAASKGMDNASVYGASKATLRSYARSFGNELKARKIRVNVISPGPIATPAFDGVPQAMKDGLVASIPLGRMGKSEEIAGAALFLASDDSSFVTGVELFVDGGTAQI